MQIGIIGLGKMGSGLISRLISDNHEVVAFDTDQNGELSLPECLRKWSKWARDGRNLGSLYK